MPLPSPIRRRQRSRFRLPWPPPPIPVAERYAATALAERVTAASGPPRGAEGSEQCRSVWSYRSPPAQRHRTDSVRADKQHGRPGCPYDGASRDQIGVDLAGKGVAIEYQQSEAGTSIRIAIAAAGAVEVQLNQGHTKAIDRLIAGEVPAAILTLVSPEAAEWFPDITGYRIFRIPLSPIH
jgi:hypothetical protein